jgi:serine/threonine protein kinase
LARSQAPSARRSIVKVKAGLKELMNNWNLDKKCVGVGCYGQVFLATNTQDPTVHVAVKILNKSKMSLTEQQAVKREVGILQTLDHPNIVDYLETYNYGKLPRG